MPMYEYECGSCGNRFELIQKFSDKPVRKCPKCGKTGKVKRLVSSSAIQFKGSGWYVTDYGKGNGPSQAKSESKIKKEGGEDTAAPKTEKAEKAKDSTPASSTPSTTK